MSFRYDLARFLFRGFEILVTEKKATEQCFLFVLAQTPNWPFQLITFFSIFDLGLSYICFFFYSKVYKL